MTALFYAVYIGNVEAVKILLSNEKLDINIINIFIC